MRFEVTNSSTHSRKFDPKLTPLSIHIRPHKILNNQLKKEIRDLNTPFIDGTSIGQHTLHFGQSDFVISEDFQTVISDFTKGFNKYKPHFVQGSK